MLKTVGCLFYIDDWTSIHTSSPHCLTSQSSTMSMTYLLSPLFAVTQPFSCFPDHPGCKSQNQSSGHFSICTHSLDDPIWSRGLNIFMPNTTALTAAQVSTSQQVCPAVYLMETWWLPDALEGYLIIASNLVSVKWNSWPSREHTLLLQIFSFLPPCHSISKTYPPSLPSFFLPPSLSTTISCLIAPLTSKLIFLCLYPLSQFSSHGDPFKLSLHAKLLQSCPTLCDLMGCSSPVSPVHGILQLRILEWVAVPFSRGSSWPRHGNHISYISCIG